MLKLLPKKRIIWLSLAALFSAICHATGDTDQFAYQAKLSASRQALQRIELPVEVLLEVTRADLGDIAVLDADGKRLAAWVRKLPPQHSPAQIDLTFYRFHSYEKVPPKTVTRRQQEQRHDQLSEVTTTETIAVNETTNHYIIELPEADSGIVITDIRMQWLHQPADQLLRLKLETGNSLDQWRMLQPDKSLTNLHPDNDEWRSISNIPRDQKYLRLTPLESVQSFELLKVSGSYLRTAQQSVLTYTLPALHRAPEHGEFYAFNMPSPVKALTLRIIPGEAQGLINGDLFASEDTFERKHLIRSNIQQHNISNNNIKPSQAIALPLQNYLHWWFKPGQPLASTPQIAITLPVYELLFLGNDNGPFTLSWGNFESGAPTNRLIGMLDNQQPGETVQLGAKETAGGVSRLSPTATLPWFKWLLWSLLVLAAFTTGRMALSLYRDMNKA